MQKPKRPWSSESLLRVLGRFCNAFVLPLVDQVCSSQGLLQGPIRPLELGSAVAAKEGKI